MQAAEIVGSGVGDGPRSGTARDAVDPSVDLKALQAFQVLADCRHFGRAAARLGMTQPPLSIRIRGLEAALGVRLFDRGRAGVTLTAAGEALMAEVGPLFERHRRLVQQVRATARGDAGDLRVGFVTPAEFSFLPERLREFRARTPGIRLQLSEMTSDAQTTALLEGRLDVGFVLPPVVSPALHYRPVARERLVVALAARHRLARGRGSLTAAQLANEALVIFPRDKAPALFDQIMQALTGPAGAPAIGQEAIQMPTIVSLVAAGLGIALVPDSLRNLGRKGVVYRALAGAPSLVETGIAWRRDSHDARCQRFIAFMTDA